MSGTATPESPGEAASTDAPEEAVRSTDAIEETATAASSAAGPDVERVLVAGATGATGGRILDVLGETGLQVRALTTSADQRDALLAAGADEVVVGDLLEPAAAARAVGIREAGDGDPVDAVLCAVGSTVTEVFLADRLVDGPGVVNLARAAVDAGVERFVFQSAIGVGDSRPRPPLLYKLPIARPLEAKARAEEALRAMDVAHTVVRPGVLTNGPRREDLLVAEGGDTVFGLVSRADVARLMVSALATPAAAGRTFEVVSDRWTWGEQSGLVDVAWADPAVL